MSIIENALKKAKREGRAVAAYADVPQTPTPNPRAVSGTSATAKPISTIDWQRLAQAGFISPDAKNILAVEEYRNIKRPLMQNAFGKASKGITRPNLILVTSSVPGEGKTFTAINLALSIASERDKQVLLIDGDVAKPSVAKALGITQAPGLMEYLENDQLAVADIMVATDLPGFRVIPAGQPHQYSTELLSSNKMATFVEELSQRYDDRVVIFDSPPLLAATQGEILAKWVGQIILVVEAEKTLQSTVLESVEKLSSCDIVLALFNKARNHYNGSYGYGYGYGLYGAEG